MNLDHIINNCRTVKRRKRYFEHIRNRTNRSQCFEIKLRYISMMSLMQSSPKLKEKSLSTVRQDQRRKQPRCSCMYIITAFLEMLQAPFKISLMDYHSNIISTGTHRMIHKQMSNFSTACQRLALKRMQNHTTFITMP